MQRLSIYILLLITLAPRPCPAQIKEIRLQKLLSALADKDYKVRLQAAIILGRYRERRSVPALIMRLDDKNSLVQGMSAHALGLIGDSRALAPLKKMRKDSSKIVRTRVAIALRQIKKQLRRERARKRRDRPGVIQLRLARLAANTKRGKRLLPRMRKLWIRQLSANPRLRLITNAPKKADQGSYEVTSTLTKIELKRRRRTLEMTCSISLILGDHQGKILMMTSGGATVQESATRRRRAPIRGLQESAMENAISSAYSSMLRYLQARTGGRL